MDAFVSKVNPHINSAVRAATEEDRDKSAEELVAAVTKDIEPNLVEGKGPYYGGSETLTLAEVSFSCPKVMLDTRRLTEIGAHWVISSPYPWLLQA